MKKKVILLSLALMLLLTGVVSAASLWGKYDGFNIIRITVDGKTIEGDIPAMNYKGRTMVPIYMLKDAGVNYKWNGENQSVDITSNTPSSNTFDPTAATNEIINLGGAGVTIMNIQGDSTAMVYFEQKVDFDRDWATLDKIFNKLLAFKSTYSRIEYGVSGEVQGIVEIRSQDYKDYLNGALTSDQLDKLWILSGPMFPSNNGSTNTGSTNTGGQPPIIVEYPELYSNDLKTFLGKLTTNAYDIDSIFNEYGTYGSEYQSKSIWNNYGTYGGEFSNQSPFNKFATEPPAIVLDGKVIGYLSLNTTINGAVSPVGLESFLEDLGY